VNYDGVISRTHDDIHKAECCHGLLKESCSYCSGHYMATMQKVKKEQKVDSDLINQYEMLKEKFKSYRDIWTEEEFYFVYDNLKDVIGTKAEAGVIYKTAIQLQRTRGAIIWSKLHLFSEKDYNRGKVVLQLRKFLGLDKGV